VPSNPDRDRELAGRLLALEESHTFMARTLEELGDEVNKVGTMLVALARRVDRLDERMGGADGPGGGGDGGMDE